MKLATCLLVLAFPLAFANAQSGNNDDCSNAIEISFGSTGFSTLNASTDGPPLPGDCDEGFGTGFGFDIWFTLTPDQSGGIVVSTCDTADFDTRLAVYTACNGTLIACNDDGPGCGGFTSQMNFDGVEGETYLLRVGGFDNERGTGTISVEYGDGPPETPNINSQRSCKHWCRNGKRQRSSCFRALKMRLLPRRSCRPMRSQFSPRPSNERQSRRRTPRRATRSRSSNREASP